MGYRAHVARRLAGDGELGIPIQKPIRLGQGPDRHWLLDPQQARTFIDWKSRPNPRARPGTQWSSVIEAPVRAHSEKPERFFEMIEAYFPNLPKIELYRRGLAREGWDAWGLEAK
jgi:N6-adenosine-specific RNA methylase IME4